MLFVSDDDSILIHLLLFGSDSGQVLSCTLWENYCLQFLSYLNEVEDDDEGDNDNDGDDADYEEEDEADGMLNVLFI